MLISKFFRVAQEGATTDGRAITREQIEQMAKNYNQKKYGARIWLEHFRSILPDSSFKALGDVVAVKTQEEDGKLGLYASLKPTPELVKINQAQQKIYSSIELDPDFSDTGEAYLVGLAVTDSPASLGTEAMAFSSNADISLFSDRKQRKENLFTASTEATIEFEEKDDDKPSLFSRVKDMLNKDKAETAADFSEVHKSIELVAESQQSLLDKAEDFSKSQVDAKTELDKVKQSHDELAESFNALKSQLEDSPGGHYKERPPAAGGEDKLETDC